jgi:7-keto-8-aminopelargonate synthetase-like enzyme
MTSRGSHQASAAVASALADAERARVLFQSVGEGGYSGRYVDVAGRALLNFASYDYLGLSRRDELKQGAVEATWRYGTQFPFPRAMLQSQLYLELEDLLSRMTGGHVVVASSTTLAHVAALPVVVEAGDAVVIDESAHASLFAACALLPGIPIASIPARRFDLLERELESTFALHRRIWFVCDGMSPLHGDFAPIDELSDLIRKYPAFHVYIDEAHSTSWTGTNGRGRALEQISDRSRVVVALSLNKAFSAAGGVVVFEDPSVAARVLRGRYLAFSGAIPPPMLGAAVASAKIHLSPDLVVLQERLAHNIRRVISQASELGVPLADTTETPLFFLPCGSNERTLALTQSLRDRGIYVCGVVFPLVLPERTGIRFTISVEHEFGDIDNMMRAIADCTGNLPVSL